MLLCAGCGGVPGIPLPDESTAPVDAAAYELLARFVHISDAHIVDEESPARLASAADFTLSAWRPYEAYSTQLLDGTVRAINKMHVAQHNIDFVIHTGDATDNAQLNELRWFVDLMNGGRIDPLSGVDDRDPTQLPQPSLDPHQPFDAQGLYRNGLHGDAPAIPWYTVLGNHDRFGVGVFPIVFGLLGQRIAPLPVQNRIGLFLPVVLDPVGSVSWGPISPAHPGPPPRLNLPALIEANPDRRYLTQREFIADYVSSEGEPAGHGFDPNQPTRGWYSVSPVAGVRLIGLNSARPLIELPTLVYSEGAILLPQVNFLRAELQLAAARGEVVIVATHHPSDSLEPSYGSALSPQSFQALLNEFDCVALHVAGHWHRHAVIDRGGYVEIVTASIIDAPQEGRVIEIWRERSGESSPSSLLAKGGLGGVRDASPSAASRKSGRHSSPLAKGGLRGVFLPSRNLPQPLLVKEGGKTSSGFFGNGTSAWQTTTPPVAPRRILRYRQFSHLDEIATPDDSQAALFNDPLLDLRRRAAELAEVVP